VKPLLLKILTPDTPDLAMEDVVSVVVPSAPGSFGAMADHAPMIAPVGAGVLRYTDQAGHWHYVVVGEGVADVGRESISLLVGFAKTAPDETTADQILENLTQFAQP
jgi:F-type H+-transporting ATPase subunit epsilon